MLPRDAAERARQHGLVIGYFEVYPEQRPRIVTSWRSKDDLIETILASCNFPFYFSRSPLVKCRDTLAVDGFWAVEPERFGCPPVPGERNVVIIAQPLSTMTSRNAGANLVFDPSNIIQPGRPGMELSQDLSDRQWSQWQTYPVPDMKVNEMIEAGRAHARTWAVEQRLVPAAASVKLLHPEADMRRRLRPTQALQCQLRPQQLRRQWCLPPLVPRCAGSHRVAITALRLAVITKSGMPLIGMFAGSALAFAMLQLYLRLQLSSSPRCGRERSMLHV
eukprot:gnl/TRDRNA2_/TRDRNA2_150609_c0_seq1.p1 gnl/TRDRNA2_/TRDRNA2_150609_c0~~gnl/TRDRNA2_/TRDRNA2_150609_c0_seq1.p1  ORF type:complete len:277 (+),score=18.33 gnl/TRDRNA2_/TRDRNA2_150609_c0_seq1:424-1254(+)